MPAAAGPLQRCRGPYMLFACTQAPPVADKSEGLSPSVPARPIGAPDERARRALPISAPNQRARPQVEAPLQPRAQRYEKR
eukprot:4087650-Pyramimonas_sp.AAC.1